MKEKLTENLKKVVPFLAFPALYLFCLLLFCSWTFPYEKLKERIIVSFNTQQRTSGSTQQLQIESISSSFITGIVAKGVKFVTPSTDPQKPGSELKIDEARARISLLSLLVGNRDVSFNVHAFGGTINGSYDDRGKDKAVELEFEDVDLALVDALSGAIGVPVEGKLQGSMRFDIPEGKTNKANGNLALDFKDVAIGDGKAKLKDALALPRLSIGNLTMSGDAKDGLLKISKLAAGGKDVEILGDGRIQLREPATEAGLDLNVRFKINDAYRTKNDVTKSLFGAPGSNAPALFELADVKVKQSKRPDGFYAWHARGPISKPEFDPAPAGR